MKKGKIILISSILSIVLCLSIVLGFTFAVFTDTARVSIGLHSGSIQMDAYVTNFNLYSAKKYTEADMDNKEIVYDSNGDAYVYEKRSKDFVNGGTANISKDILTFENICPGDRVDFDVEVANKGKIAIQYNAIISLVDQMENILFNAMNIQMTAGEDKLVELPPFRTGPSSLRTQWLSLGLEEEGKIHVSFGLPIMAENIYQGMEVKFKCSLAAIQDLGDNNSLANIFDANGDPVLNEDGTPIIVSTLEEAINVTPNGGLIDVIRGNERGLNQNITIDKSVRIQSSDTELKNFANVHISVTRGGALQMKDICLKGDSYIDISTATALSLEHCIFDVAPSKLFDESTREYLAMAAGVVSTAVQQSGIHFDCINSTFSTTDSTSVAVYMLSALSEDSIFENNVFGNTTFTYMNSPIYLSGTIALDSDIAMINVVDNKFYLNDRASAITLQKNGETPYYLNSQSNVVIGGNKLIHMNEEFAIMVLDTASTIHGVTVTLDELGAENTTIFRALNAQMNDEGKFVAGTFKLGSGLTEEMFRSAFVYRLALEHNIIIVQ